MSSTLDKKRVAVFVDTSGLYHKVQRKFQAKLCYDAYYAVCEEVGSIVKAIAYGMQMDGEAGGFIKCLESIGFETKFKKARIFTFGDHRPKFCNWDSVMTMDIMEQVHSGVLDVVIIGSANLDLIPLIKWIRTRGVRVVMVASDVTRNFGSVVDGIVEINGDMLEDEEYEDD